MEGTQREKDSEKMEKNSVETAHEHEHEYEHGHSHEHEHEHGEGSRKAAILRMAVTAALLAGCMIWKPEGYIAMAAYAVPYLLIGWDVLRAAFSGIIHGELLDESFLMAIASLGAFAVGEQAEGVAVMLFYQVGEFFQDLAADRTRDSIAKLTDVRPDSANVERGGEVAEVMAEDVRIGEVIVVKPGERVPLDGEIVSGTTELDQSALTGESMPNPVGEGDTALAGSVNLRGLIRVRVEKGYSDSEVARILRLVEDASERKAKSERFITRFARVYTPVVVGLALLCALIPPIFTHDFSGSVYRALIFLVVSCPCALVLSVPLSFFAGIGALSRHGVLIKGGSFMDRLAKAGIFVFDKTGTLTGGRFRVAEVRADDRAALIETAALAESYSDHPLARAIAEEYGAEPDRGRVADVQEFSGRGVSALVDGRRILAGNARLMSENGISVDEIPGTVIYVASEGVFAGAVRLSDTPRKGMREALGSLRSLGVKRFVMLTGDTAAAAEEVAGAVGIADYRSGLMPSDKVSCMEAVSASREKGDALIFVGDGINDAPALAVADVGVAMGAAGSDAAIEAADVVLMDDNPAKLALAVKGSRKTLAIARQNIVISLAVKIAVMALGALGVAGMWAAVFADVGVCLLAVLNATRAMRI